MRVAAAPLCLTKSKPARRASPSQAAGKGWRKARVRCRFAAAEIAGGNADAGYFNCQAQELIGLTLRANFVRVPTKVSHKAIADVYIPLFNAAANVALVWT